MTRPLSTFVAHQEFWIHSLSARGRRSTWIPVDATPAMIRTTLDAPCREGRPEPALRPEVYRDDLEVRDRRDLDKERSVADVQCDRLSGTQ